MKLAICSDLHLEFGSIKLENTEKAEILILAGDIFIASALDEKRTDAKNLKLRRIYKEFLNNISEEFCYILYIMGNHEHYHGTFNESASLIQKFLNDYPYVTFLNNSKITIKNTTFIGTTLWTDFNHANPVVMNGLQFFMNDFHIVNFEKKVRFLPQHAYEQHVIAKQFIDSSNDSNVVVITHHTPSFQSEHPWYKDQYEMNYGYTSNLDDMIYNHPEFKLWIHGHVHTPFDYMIGNTRVVCNPRGYVGHVSAENFKLRYVDV